MPDEQDRERPASTATIAECTVEDLVQELLARCPAIVVGACVPDADGKPESDTTVWSAGSRVACLGLATLVRARQMRIMLGTEEE